MIKLNDVVGINTDHDLEHKDCSKADGRHDKNRLWNAEAER
jgi:hypothetical protein